MHVVTKGLFTHPLKSFFILCHNHPIEMAMLAKHPLVELLKSVKTVQELMAITKNHVNDWSQPATCALLPKAKVIDFKSMGLNLDIDFVSFQHSFY